MKIYTKTGDEGQTSLFDGSRVGKDHDRVDLYGEIDELNGFVGFAASLSQSPDFVAQLQQVQRDLFALGAKLANPQDRKQKDKAEFEDSKVERLEQEIDGFEASLEPMKSFILPGGTGASSVLHIARCVCRRAERKLVHFAKSEDLNPIYLKYVNRLSDYLFVAARFANHLENRTDVPWE